MPVNLSWDSQDAIPEVLKEHAVEKDGKWVFEAETSAEVGNLKKTLDKERKSRTQFEAEVKKFERFKPLTEAEEEEVEQFLENWNKRGEGDKGKKGQDPDATKQLELKDKLHEKQLKKLGDELGLTKTELQKAQVELRDFKLWTPLREVFIKAGGEASDWELARLELANQGRFGFDDDGKIVVMEDGSPSTVSPDKFFKEVYSDQRPKFYKASGAGGSGAPANQQGGRAGQKTVKRAEFDKMGPTEQRAHLKAGGAVVD